MRDEAVEKTVGMVKDFLMRLVEILGQDRIPKQAPPPKLSDDEQNETPSFKLRCKKISLELIKEGNPTKARD